MNRAVRLLAGVLTDRAAADPELASVLAGLIADAEQAGLLRRTTTTGGIRVGGDLRVQGRGHTIVGGDQTVLGGQPAPEP